MTGIKITDLQPGQCRFPVTPDSAPKHFFCGEPVEYPKCPYCPTHAERCFDRRADEVKRAHAQRAAVARAAAKAAREALEGRPSARPKF